MPPRKNPDFASASRLSNGTVDDEAPPARAPRQGSSVADLALPRSVIARLAKGMLPPNTSIQSDALLAISKSATVFVNYLATTANDRAAQANKRSIRPEDVVEALPDLEFESFVSRVEAQIEKYYSIQSTKRNDYRRRVKEEQKTTTGEVEEQSDSFNGADPSRQLDFEAGMRRIHADINGTRESPPAAKKARTSLAGASNGFASGHEDDTLDDTEEEVDEVEEVEDEVIEPDEEEDDSGIEQDEEGEDFEEEGSEEGRADDDIRDSVEVGGVSLDHDADEDDGSESE